MAIKTMMGVQRRARFLMDNVEPLTDADVHRGKIIQGKASRAHIAAW